MDADSWAARLSSSSKRNLFNSQSRSVGMKWDGFDAEMLMGFEEIDMDDDIREEYACPFCSEYFDILGLCCHIDDEHPVEAKNAICPVCAMRVDVDLVGHITLRHANIFKVQRKRKSLKVGLHSKLSLLRRELGEGKLQSLYGGSSHAVSSCNTAPDPLLSSFISPIFDDFGSAPSHSSELGSVNRSAATNIPERNTQPPPLSIEDREEKVKRCEFAQGLLLSTILVDNL
ncbi:protein DEHYDRATION-INDUCED 19 homolog 6-like isoform X1 [Olea europaea var. sylvestris]|uniref:protein DEHYDRATION-INDUCED 19 homolog 6-like isoform X1 n=1 Tax=Olea europaea var. sylvestris TaxID=158386 RepID=UPI000C1D8976|nr:protein DEHYDRATION-INDUCED 19 homolog 6-like isoform X1 [Olea europaea var. sylvestris]XP_022858024.1 protein DEHYDRATION-INDUCED 19 homolog 6-like isoform X1 [Olea europaea var. sylvestris]XP_022858025.1 protein DEHYDRATION-INDUCED 19 homolog 6-like isoform X1 [Olea europaea var. sylvestris]